MEFGIVFWSVIAYSLLMPLLVRAIMKPLLGKIIRRRTGEGGVVDLDRRMLTLLLALTGGMLLLSGPLAWAQQVQRLIPEDQPEEA